MISLATKNPKRTDSALDEVLALLRAKKGFFGTFGLSVLAGLVAARLDPLVGEYVGWMLWGVSVLAGAVLILVILRWARKTRAELAGEREQRRLERLAARQRAIAGRDAPVPEEVAKTVPAKPVVTSPGRRRSSRWGSAVLATTVVIGSLGALTLALEPELEDAAPTDPPDAAATAAPVADVYTPPRLLDLWTKRVEPSQVELGWDATGDVGEFRIYSASDAARVPGWRDSYVMAARPGSTHRIQVRAYGESGSLGDQEWITVLTPTVARWNEARLAGTWRIDLRTIETSGAYAEDRPGDEWRDTWTFRPRCASGPCDVSFDLNLASEEPGILQRHGTRYVGTKNGRARSCDVTEAAAPRKASVTLDVVAIGVVGGKWRAVKVRGRLKTVDPAFGGCELGAKTSAFTGRLRR